MNGICRHWHYVLRQDAICIVAYSAHEYKSPNVYEWTLSIIIEGGIGNINY